MKNNLILIAVVSLISIAVILISIFVNSGGTTSDISGDVTSVTTGITSAVVEETEPKPQTTLPQPTEEAVTTEATQEAELSDETILALIDTAHALIGVDFYQGGTNPSVGFDNSGFIYYVLRENGFITCPRSIREQTEMGTKLAYDEITPGDLVYFSAENSTEPGYGGIYIGDGKMITCQMPGTQVKEVTITTQYYRENFYCGVSIV